MTLTYQTQYSTPFSLKKLLLLLFLFTATSCSPSIQTHKGFFNKPKLLENHFVTSDGLRLTLKQWPPNDPPIGVVLGLHGFNDHSGAFSELGQRLSSLGFTFYAYDQRGFGNTNERGIWASTHTLVNDALELSKLIKSQHPKIPLTVLGESMGGAVLLTALDEKYKNKSHHIDGAILSAPAVGGRSRIAPWQTKLLDILAHTIPMVRLEPQGLNIKPSDNIEMLRALRADPKYITQTRIDAIYGLLDLMDTALNAAKRQTKPLLILYGANDDLVTKKSICGMLKVLKGKKWRLVVYPDGYHLLFRDLKATLVVNDMASWLRGQQNKFPSGYEQNNQTMLKTVHSFCIRASKP